MAPNPEMRGMGDWEREGNTCTITFVTSDTTSGPAPWQNVTSWYDYGYSDCTNSNCYDFDRDEAHRARVKAYWNAMRAPRLWWFEKRSYNARASQPPPSITRINPCAIERRKQAGRPYGGLKAALRRISR